MKSPVPVDVFPPLEISPNDAEALRQIAAEFVQERISEYHEHMVQRKGVVDVEFWKRIRVRDQLCVYKERYVKPTAIDESGVTALMPKLFMVGALQGDLDDVMYGAMNYTTEDMHIRTAYIGDRMCDGRILACLTKPTVADPLNTLTLKWDLRENLFIAPPPLVRLRDVVFMDGSGIVHSTSGERFGYILAHSVKLPGIHELQEHNIVRGDVSVCFLFRQIEGNVVSVYAKAIMNMFGSIPVSIVTTLAAETLLSVWRYVKCAELKKLAWVSRTFKPTDLGWQNPKACAVCMKKVKTPSNKGSKGYCCACRKRICSRCSVMKKLASSPSNNPKAVSMVAMTFCTRCVLRAMETSAVDVSTYDIYAADFNSFTPDTSSSSSSF